MVPFAYTTLIGRKLCKREEDEQQEARKRVASTWPNNMSGLIISRMRIHTCMHA